MQNYPDHGDQFFDHYDDDDGKDDDDGWDGRDEDDDEDDASVEDKVQMTCKITAFRTPIAKRPIQHHHHHHHGDEHQYHDDPHDFLSHHGHYKQIALLN